MNNNNIKQKIKEAFKKLSNLEKEIIENEEKFRLLAEFSYDWIYWQDVEGNFIYISPSFEKITEYQTEELYNNKNLIKEIIHPDDWENWQNHSHAMLENGDVEPMEFKIIKKYGAICWIHHVCKTVCSENSENLGVRGSNRDITHQILLREEIKILRGFIPICASCKKIRDDEGFWKDIEVYIEDHSEVEFSHSLCPECAKKLYPKI